MRQRTISDSFWRDPDTYDLSQEDKATLFYFLTSPSSNIVGVYQVVWRIAAAEMGWTSEQLLTVVQRLESKNLLACTSQGWVWVKIWWRHNSAKGAFSPKLLASSRKQIAAIPKEWTEDVLKSIELAGINRVSIGYRYPIDTPPLSGSSNSNNNVAGTALALAKEILSGADPQGQGK